ncbi:MAG: RNA polymerase sigma factor [Bacteroidales bacterium]|nr:RNA polymerase sigma factor [Bacteroidales bacterium]
MRDEDKQMLADHYLDFYRMAFAVLRNESDVEDAVQEALARTMSRPFVSNPYQYCVQSLFNCCSAIRRKKKYLSFDQLAETYSEQESAPDYRLAVLQDLQNQLSPRIAHVFQLHYNQGLTVVQIAEKLNVSPSMIKKLMQKGHNQLRKELSEIEKKEIFNIQ